MSANITARKTTSEKKSTDKNWLRENWLRVVVHIGVWVPALWLLWRYFNDDLGVDPVTTINNVTGRTAMILLILCLSVRPLCIVFDFNQALKVRRALGLYAAMYASIHFINFIALDYGFNLNFILEDGIVEKPYIFVGLTALVLLGALAITSTKGWMKRLKKNWTRAPLAYLPGRYPGYHSLSLASQSLRKNSSRWFTPPLSPFCCLFVSLRFVGESFKHVSV